MPNICDIIFSNSYSINFSQLWLDRTCFVNLRINETICKNLTHYENYTNQVQEEVSRLNIVGRYIGTIPSIVMTLFLGKNYNQSKSIFF